MNGETSPRRELHDLYDRAFFDELSADTRSSAERIVPFVVDLLRPQSVLDVGCGLGTWLEAFRCNNVREVAGIDGPHVAVDDLEIPRECFIGHDLSEPFDLARRFDLVVSLEVAEHLDATCAPMFVETLVRHAPAVLFSAAIPFQGGAGHVNERWPSYWAGLFARHAFVAIDVVRPHVWNDPTVAFWYAQNTILYVEASHPVVAAPAPTSAASPDSPTVPLDLVHPALHVRDHTTIKPPPPPPSLSRVLRDLPGAVRRAAHNRVPGNERRARP